MLRWDPGERGLEAVADKVAELIGDTTEGTDFVFGPHANVGSPDDTILALQVLPVIVYLGGQKTVLNEFVAYAAFGPDVDTLSPVTVVIVTFALAGFANFASIGIQIGTIGSLEPGRRSEVARLGLRALLAGSLANLANAAIAGVVVTLV